MDAAQQPDEQRTSSSSADFRLLQAGPRSREITGAVDLLGHFQLREIYNSFLKKELQKASVADSGYLSRVVGETEIRRGMGMELGQLIDEPASFTDSLHVTDVRPLDLEMLRGAFTFKETTPVFIPEVDRGTATISGNAPAYKEKERKKRHKDKDRSKDKDKDKDKDKKEKRKKKKKRHKHKHDGEKGEKNNGGENGEDSHRKRKKKKRKEDGAGEDNAGDGDRHKKKSKHKHSKSGAATKDEKKSGL